MQQKKIQLSTFGGVFTPTTLTILGVIMYLRLGWVVGSAGLTLAVIIILLAKVATITTGLSLSSLATNTKVGAGGFYAVLSRSLGAEVGSAIGLPLYISQVLSCALYIIGFTEGWLVLFPSHHPFLISSCLLLLLVLISIIDVRIAIRIQYLVLALILASLVSFGLGVFPIADLKPAAELVPDKVPFWIIFAVFFPAVTGITAGASMSGDLENPKRSLPLGTLSAILLTLVIYIGLAFLLANTASPAELQSNTMIMLEKSRWSLVTMLGLMGATFSSALGSILGGPRTLMALGQDRVIPLAGQISKTNASGLPVISIVISALVVEGCLLLGDLDTIAPLLTMFFLITYASINLAVAIEKGIKLPSYRPSFNIPLIIPMTGFFWCMVIMFLIDPVFSAFSLIFVLAVYFIQTKRNLMTPWGDVRNGLFIALAEWAAKTANQLPHHAKTWKPNLLIPIEDPRSWTHIIEFVQDLTFPSGSIRVFTVRITKNEVNQRLNRMLSRIFGDVQPGSDSGVDPSHQVQVELDELLLRVKRKGIFTVATVIEARDFLEGISITAQALRGVYFPPNIIFFTMGNDTAKDRILEAMLAISIREKMGVVILSHHPKAAFGIKQRINVWVRPGSRNRDLSILLALQLIRNWEDCQIRLLTVTSKPDREEKSNQYLDTIVEKTRMPHSSERKVFVGDFKALLPEAPQADLNIIGMTQAIQCSEMHELAELAASSCLFIRDSGDESAVA